MKKRLLTAVFGGLVLLMGIMFTSCQKDKVEYQVRIQNDMYNELLGLPFMKYDVKTFYLGDHVFTDVPYGEYSEYTTVESSTDYDLSIEIEAFVYNADTYMWESTGTESYDLDPVSWVDDEDYTKHKIKLQIGDLLQLYKPIYEKYAEE